MTERLQKILSEHGLASRRSAEQMILDGRVQVNGVTAQLGCKADPDMDEITVDGKKIPPMCANVYIMLNKPRGYVTTLSDEFGRKNAAQLVADCGVRVYPVGRLDKDSEGLLLFTNDGDFANRMMHPKHEKNKTYHVAVTGYAPGGEVLLRRPIVLDGYQIRTPEVSVLKVQNDRALLSVTIHEGRNRQVRRMCDAAGMQVLMLRRVSEGMLKLGNLPLGKWRYLTKDEVAELKKE